MTTVYRAYAADGTLLYVGCTDHREKRISAHAKGSPWFAAVDRWTFEEYPTREEALRVETAAIRAERPVHNKIVGLHRRPASQERDEEALRRAVVAALILGRRELRRDGVAIPPGFDEYVAERFASGQERTRFGSADERPQPDLVSIADAARMLSVSARTVRRAIADGDIGVVRVRRRVLIPMAAIEEFGVRRAG